MAYNESRVPEVARRKSEASSRKCLRSFVWSFFFHVVDYVIAFVIAPYRQIYMTEV